MAEKNRKEQREEKLDEIFSELDELDKAIIRVKLEKPAISNVDLSEMFDVNDHKIGRRLKKDKVVQALAELQKEAIDIMIELQAGSARYLGTVVNSKKEKTTDRIRAAENILKGVLSNSHNLNIKGKVNISKEADFSKISEEDLIRILKEKNSESKE